MANKLVRQGLEELHRRQEGIWEATLIFDTPFCIIPGICLYGYKGR